MTQMSVAELRNKRQSRGSRTVPPPKHPVKAVSDTAAVAPETTLVSANTDITETSLTGQKAAPASLAGPEKPNEEAVENPAAAMLLPNLVIDWTDPEMHKIKATRATVPLDLATRFKADGHAVAQTQRALGAVVDNLSQLPDLVLSVRGEKPGGQPGFFFTPTAPRKPGPRGDVFLRLKRGEEIALEKIRVWVTDVIQRNNPGRRKATRSDLIHAALDIAYRCPDEP